jgi:uncharacterized membrane protein YhaH (DUF805 family)
MSWYLEVFRKYAQFGGRSRRKEYWYFALFNFLISLALGAIDGLTGNFDPEIGMGLLGGIYSLIIIIPSIAVTVRRLHDTDRSAWWLLIVLIPVIGIIVLIIFMLLDSNYEENQYGVSVKAA